jgi:hypothetical protein
MGYDALVAQAADVHPLVRALVAPDGFGREAAVAQFRHLAEGDSGLGGAHRGSDDEQHTQSVARIIRGIAGEAQALFLTRAFANELRLRVGARLVGLITALLPLEVFPSIAKARPLLVVVRTQALQRCALFEQRAIYAEVVARDPTVRPLQCHKVGEEQVSHLVLQHARLVLAVRLGIEHLLVQREVHEPADLQVGLQSRTELPDRPHRVQRLQHLPLQQRLQRTRGRTSLRVDLIHILVPHPQRIVGHLLNRPDRKIWRDQHLNVYPPDKTWRGGSLSAHTLPTRNYT